MRDLTEIIERARQGITSPVPEDTHCLELISFANLGETDLPGLREFQARVRQCYGVALVAVGGGPGCTKISFTIDEDRSPLVRRLLAWLVGCERFQNMAHACGFRVAITSQPYSRTDLTTGEREGYDPSSGKLFVSYSHEDSKFLEQFIKHLAMLRREGLICSWTDQEIRPGGDWRKEILTHLDAADITCFLVSADFLASDFCYDIEMKHAMALEKAGQCCTIPIIIRHCDWRSAPFAELQALPRGARPINAWDDHDEGWLNVIRGIRDSFEYLRGSERVAAHLGLK